ncbi:MAG: hypothetical protein P8171_23375 [Candidatus Thiodiazotropha sp.]
MSSKERALTGLALVLLAYWKLSIHEIPFGPFAIRYNEYPELFVSVIVLELLASSFLLARSLMWWHRYYRIQPVLHGEHTIIPVAINVASTR